MDFNNFLDAISEKNEQPKNIKNYENPRGEERSSSAKKKKGNSYLLISFLLA